MVTILYYDYLNILSIIFTVFSIYILIKYKVELNADKMIDYFIYLTNKIVIFCIMVSSLFISLLTLNSTDNTSSIIFIHAISPLFMYYIILNYMVFYGIKFFNYCKEFAVKNDLMGISFIYKKNLNKIKSNKK